MQLLQLRFDPCDTALDRPQIARLAGLRDLDGPDAHRTLVCLTEDEREYSGLAYVPMRGGIIEPITNRLAEPVIGRIVGWRYEREGCC